jgi:hypothetical protein
MEEGVGEFGRGMDAGNFYFNCARGVLQILNLAFLGLIWAMFGVKANDKPVDLRA